MSTGKLTITWHGKNRDTGAYATINRKIPAAMAERGHEILANIHNKGNEVAPVMVSCTYPPQPPLVNHRLNVCLTTWEFGGEYGVPRSFVDVYNRYDLVVAMSSWVADNLRLCGVKSDIDYIHLGSDENEFSVDGDTYQHDEIPDGAPVVLWVGGTDRRHGFRKAVEVFRNMPDRYWMIAKQSSHYPADIELVPRMIVVRDDLPSLAPLYRRADCLLHTAQAVGASMPVFEALMCDTPVVSLALPPILEIKQFSDAISHNIITISTEQEVVPGGHHLHQDCTPLWFGDGHVNDWVMAVEQVVANRISVGSSRGLLSWHRCASQLESAIVRNLDANI
jgi:glycosyltransferase involved in cell wall biosynthesis